VQASLQSFVADPVLTIPRARRIRCDETFPACYRCVSSGRICDGYGIWGGGGAIHHRIPPGSTQPLKLELMKRYERPTHQAKPPKLVISPLTRPSHIHPRAILSRLDVTWHCCSCPPRLCLSVLGPDLPLGDNGSPYDTTSLASLVCST
jgi:hypothetical protein